MQITGSKTGRAAVAALTLTLTLTLGLALAGCSDDEEPTAGPVAEVLDEAVANFVDGSSGAYIFQLGEDVDPLMRSTGDFALDDVATTLDLSLSNGERTARSEQVRIGQEAWIRVAKRDVAPTGCWQGVTPQRAAARLGLAVPSTGQEAVDLLPAAGVVTSAEGTKWISPGAIASGTADLYAVASTLGEVVKSLDLTPENTTGRVDVTFLLEDGEIVAWHTDLVTVLKALADAGTDLDREMTALVDTGAEIPVMTGFSNLGNEVEIAAPSPIC